MVEKYKRALCGHVDNRSLGKPTKTRNNVKLVGGRAVSRRSRMSECPNVRAWPRKFNKPLAQPPGLRHCTKAQLVGATFANRDWKLCTSLLRSFDFPGFDRHLVSQHDSDPEDTRALLLQLAMACKDSQRDWHLTTSHEGSWQINLIIIEMVQMRRRSKSTSY
jgi:hypothetical protein